MRRRHLLAALGAGVSLAGCVGTDAPGTPTPDETTRTPVEDGTTTNTTTPADPESLALGESLEPADGGQVTVHDVRVRRIVFTQGVHTDPYSRPGEQFVVVDATASIPERLERLAVVADGRTVAAGANDALVAPFGDPAGELLGFRVPAPLEVEGAAVRWSVPKGASARWPLDASHLHALANPPEFEVKAFEVPETVERGSAFTAALTVANAGSGDGTFRAELGATTISDTPEISVEVPAGETVTAERTVEPYYPEEADELTVRLNWGADDVERAVTVV